MPRKKLRNTTPVCARLTDEQVRHLDVVRGDMTRSRWIAMLVQGRLDAVVHDRSYPKTRGGDENEAGYIGIFVDEVPGWGSRRPRADLADARSSSQLARLAGADDGDDDDVLKPGAPTEAPVDRAARNGRVGRQLQRGAYPSTANEQPQHTHTWTDKVATGAKGSLMRCDCGALSGWVSDS